MKDYLADVLLPSDKDIQWTPTVGNVSGTAPVEVTLSGQSGLSASYLASYTPNVNDLVLTLVNDTDIVILGKLHGG